MQLRYSVRGAVGLFIYPFFILAPLFALLIESSPPRRDFWGKFAVAIGYFGPGDDGPSVRNTIPSAVPSSRRGRALALDNFSVSFLLELLAVLFARLLCF
jgi:hypothetical protein